MEIIVNADVIIAAERGDEALEAWLSSLVADQLAVSAVTVAELWHGVERASAGHKNLRRSYLQHFLSGVRILPYTESTAYEHTRIWADLVSHGEIIGLYDVIVAATAMQRHSPVATFNRRHFTRVKGLTLIDPIPPDR
jgi:predicted nucleic acid-binding protein